MAPPSHATASNWQAPPARPRDSEPVRLALFEGGPCAPLEAMVRLHGTDRRSVLRRVLVAFLLTWLPLVVLTALTGQALGSSFRDSMLLDPAMHARFLVALPLLIVAAPVLTRQLQSIAQHFLRAEIVKTSERERFQADIAAIMRWRDSRIAFALIAGVAALHALALGAASIVEAPASWRVTTGHLSPAGWWLVVVSQPLYDIAVLQFGYRVALWWRFLWRVSRLDLQLNGTHPDGAGGLAFVASALPAFRLPLFAIGASSAGTLANVLLWTGASFSSFKYAIAALAIVLVGLTVGPLVFFNAPLARAKHRSALVSGLLAGRQLRAFEAKWLGEKSFEADETFRAPDFSSVDHLNATVASVHRMNTLPFLRKHLIPLAAAVLIPFLPVAMLEFPIDEILSQLWNLLR